MAATTDDAKTKAKMFVIVYLFIRTIYPPLMTCSLKALYRLFDANTFTFLTASTLLYKSVRGAFRNVGRK